MKRAEIFRKIEMRRYFFYFVTGLLAFLVGLNSIADSYWPIHEISVVVDEPVVPESSTLYRDETVSKGIDTITDEDEMAFEVLKPTIQKWLRGEKVKNEFTDPSNISIKEITGKNNSELSEHDKSWLMSFRFEPALIDVNGDGRNELALRNQCAAAGNCQFWVLRKHGKGFEIILKTLPAAVQIFKLLKNKTNGHFDLETRDHGDAWSGGIAIYKYDGQKYKIRECSTYSYSYLKDGKMIELKKPIIEPADCYEE